MIGLGFVGNYFNCTVKKILTSGTFSGKLLRVRKWRVRFVCALFNWIFPRLAINWNPIEAPKTVIKIAESQSRRNSHIFLVQWEWDEFLSRSCLTQKSIIHASTHFKKVGAQKKPKCELILVGFFRKRGWSLQSVSPLKEGPCNKTFFG